MRRAIYKITVAGQDISSRLAPLLTSLEISDHEGFNSDTCRFTLDDRDYPLRFPKTGDRMEVSLGWEDDGPTAVFAGTVDEVKSQGSRGGGRELTIAAKGVDTQGPAKQHQQRSFQNANLKTVMERVGRDAGITSVRIDPALASIQRDWWGLNDESFLHFGERMAREVGGIFKISGNSALLARKTGGSASGATLAPVRAVFGENLINWEISPVVGRPRHGRTRARHYDSRAGRWRERLIDVEPASGAGAAATATATNRYPRADEDEADEVGGSDAQEAARRTGSGTVEIEGNATARPGSPLEVVGARPGIDGTYRIKAVDHTYSRGGWTTRIEVELPSGTAGRDSRRGAASSAEFDAEVDRNSASVPPSPAPPG